MAKPKPDRSSPPRLNARQRIRIEDVINGLSTAEKGRAGGVATLGPDGTVTGAVNSVAAVAPLTVTGTSAVTVSTSIATNKLIGRYSAGTGVMQEVTIGSGLSLSGGGTLTATSSGDVTGPAGATDNAVARFDTTTGKLIQNSVVLIGDTGVVTGASISADQIKPTVIGSPTYATAQDYLNVVLSSGYVSGGTITDAGANTVNVTAGTGFIRVSASAVAGIRSFNWSASLGLSVPSNTVRWVAIDYNAGSPIVVVSSTDSFDDLTTFAIGLCFNEGGTITCVSIPQRTGNAIGKINERWHGTRHIARDEYVGGLVLTESADGARHLAVSAGTLWHRLDSYAVAALNTAAASTFTRYYRDGVGGWTTQTGQTTWDNTHYDDGTGALATLGANKYAVQWLYVDLSGALLSVFGQAQYNTSSQAQAESPPVPPPRLQYIAILIGAIVFQKSATTPVTTLSAWTETFAASVVTDHAALASLPWTSSGHTGTASNLAGFSGAGAAAYVPIGAAGGVLAYTATPQTISSATGTINDGTEIVRVTHAAVTALTLPALANTTRQLTVTGPASVAGVDPTCVFVRAGSDVIDSGATGFKVQGSNWVVVLESDGAVWRLVSQRGMVQLPVGYVDLTGVSGSAPFTRTDSVNGETVTITDTSTSGSISAASGVQITTPLAGTAVYASSTGAGFYADVLARAGIDVVRDEYAVLVKLSETSTPAASDADAVFLGTTIAASTKLGMGYTETGGVVSVRYGTTSYTVATTATGHAAKGIWYDGRSRSWEALEGAWSGTAQSTLWPLSYARPGGVEKHAMDTAATSAPLDMALATRLVVAASTGAGGARNWLAEYLYVVRILRG